MKNLEPLSDYFNAKRLVVDYLRENRGEMTKSALSQWCDKHLKIPKHCASNTIISLLVQNNEVEEIDGKICLTSATRDIPERMQPHRPDIDDGWSQPYAYDPNETYA